MRIPFLGGRGGRLPRVSVHDAEEDIPLSIRGEHGAYLTVTVPPRRLLVAGIVVGAVVFAFLARAFTLQVLSGGSFRARAEQNRVRAVREDAPRGIFYDRANRPLVANVPSFAVTMVGADLPEEDAALASIRDTLFRYGLSADEWRTAVAAARATPFETLVVTDRLSYEQAVMLAVEEPRLAGVSVRITTRRSYLPGDGDASVIAHVLGYDGRISAEEYATRKRQGYALQDRIGKTGLEASLETTLRGSPGSRKIEVDAFGREKRTLSRESARAGTSVRLTIDLEAQQALARALARGLRAAGAKRGAALAVDPRSGDLLALVSLPAYDPNAFAAGITEEAFAALMADADRPLYPRAVVGQYPSGSTIKPVVAAAALAEGIVTPSTQLPSTGGIWYQKRWFFPDWKPGGHGPTNVVKALAESVNSFFYLVGGGDEKRTGLGPDRLAAYDRRFGFGSPLGIELPDESPGLIPDAAWKRATKGEDWYIGDTYHLAIGQGDVLVTPLQIAMMTAAVANGGTVWRPRLVAATHDPSGDVWTNAPTRKIAENADLADELAVVRTGMRSAVTVGSARSLGTLAVHVAGKTGTAEWNDAKRPHAWFTGYAPAEEPEIVVTVLVEEGGEGSSAAVPVAREFLSWYFAERG